MGAEVGLVTRDFLGGCSQNELKELDLDLHVPSCWEKRLDLKSGKVYIQRSNPENPSPDQRDFANKISSKLRNLNSFPQSPNIIQTIHLVDDTSTGLKLIPDSSPSAYTSACTLDKVKLALNRAEKSSTLSSSFSGKRWMVPSIVGSQSKCSLSPSTSNSSSLSIKETEDEDVSPSIESGLLVAAACPCCFLYVLVPKNDPKCPKCNSVVQSPVMVTKKPKFDLNT